MVDLLFKTGYRTAASFIAFGTWALIFFVLTWFNVAQATQVPADIGANVLTTVFGMPMWHLLVSLGSGGAAYGAMLMRVKHLEDEQQALKAEFKELVRSLHADHDLLVKTVERREAHSADLTIIRDRLSVLESHLLHLRRRHDDDNDK